MVETADNDNKYIEGEIVPYSSKEYASVLFALGHRYSAKELIAIKNRVTGDDNKIHNQRQPSLFVVRTPLGDNKYDYHLLELSQLVGLPETYKAAFLRDILNSNMHPKPIPVRAYLSSKDTIKHVVPKMPPETPTSP
jgi:hypothetical protein